MGQPGVDVASLEALRRSSHLQRSLRPRTDRSGRGWIAVRRWQAQTGLEKLGGLEEVPLETTWKTHEELRYGLMSEFLSRRGAVLILCLMSVLVLLTGMSRVSVPDAPMSSRALWRIDLAKASLPELQLLPGIGPVLAARLEAWRRRGENLDALDDLLDIHGIGPRTIRSLQPLVSVTASSSPDEFKNED